MSRIDFYHLQKQTLDEVLPKLLQKVYASGKNALVKVGTAERIDFINSLLWTYDDESFLPHGSKKDGFADQQPIWLTTDDDNPNKSTMLFLVDGAQVDVARISEFERVFNVFDGNLPEELDQARNLWKLLKNAGYDIYYWQQSANGTWHQHN